MFRSLAIGVALGVVAASAPARGLDLRVEARTLHAKGPIVAGDAERFAALLAALPRDPLGTIDLEVAFDSPGGDLAEAIRLGQALRVARLATNVHSGESCRGACVAAYLGGTVPGAIGEAIERRLEPGANLDLEGLRGEPDRRLSLLAYASMLGGVDVGYLSRALSAGVPAERLVRSPEGLKALTVTLPAKALTLVGDWPRNACLSAVRGRLNPIRADDSDERVAKDVSSIRDVGDLRARMLDDKYPEDDEHFSGLRRAMQAMAASLAIDALADQPLIDNRVGALAASRLRVERGSGFAFDSCYVVTDFKGISVVLIDGVSHRAAPSFMEVYEGFPYRTPLW